MSKKWGEGTFGTNEPGSTDGNHVLTMEDILNAKAQAVVGRATGIVPVPEPHIQTVLRHLQVIVAQLDEIKDRLERIEEKG